MRILIDILAGIGGLCVVGIVAFLVVIWLDYRRGGEE